MPDSRRTASAPAPPPRALDTRVYATQVWRRYAIGWRAGGRAPCFRRGSARRARPHRAAAAVRRSRSRPTSAPARAAASSGSWFVDGFGLPAYRYRLDPDRDARTRQPELDGSTDAWHQLGNDHIVATAHTRGHVQLWSQDRSYQWVNLAEPAAGHYAGGYGYLRTAGGRVISTLYADRPAGARTRRDFATGYFGGCTAVRGVAVDERVYAPFGDDPLLLHDVTIRNTSRRALRASWFEYWGVNPRSAVNKRHLGLAPPAYDRRRRTLSARPAAGRRRLAPADDLRRRPAAAGWPTGRPTARVSSAPAAARGPPRSRPGRLVGHARRRATPGGSPGRHLFAFRAPVVVRPGRIGDAALRLRPRPRAARSRARQALARRRRSRSPAASSALERLAAARAPRRGPRLALARAPVGRLHAALGRDLRGDVRATTSSPRAATTSTSSASRPPTAIPLQHILPLIYADPELARETIRYSAAEQSSGVGVPPLLASPRCASRTDHGTSADLDLWLLLAAAEYGLATRDLSFFDERLRWAGGGSGVALAPPAPGVPQPGEPARPARRYLTPARTATGPTSRRRSSA